MASFSHIHASSHGQEVSDKAATALVPVNQRAYPNLWPNAAPKQKEPLEEDEDHHSSEDFDGPSKALT